MALGALRLPSSDPYKVTSFHCGPRVDDDLFDWCTVGTITIQCMCESDDPGVICSNGIESSCLSITCVSRHAIIEAKDTHTPQPTHPHPHTQHHASPPTRPQKEKEEDDDEEEI